MHRKEINDKLYKEKLTNRNMEGWVTLKDCAILEEIPAEPEMVRPKSPGKDKWQQHNRRRIQCKGTTRLHFSKEMNSHRCLKDGRERPTPKRGTGWVKPRSRHLKVGVFSELGGWRVPLLFSTSLPSVILLMRRCSSTLTVAKPWLFLTGMTP